MDNQMRQAPRLGEVLVQHNVITLENLAVALEEQQHTGRPLGAIIVERGFAPAHFVAQALATQYGGMVKTEYGYATGFQARANLEPVAIPAAEQGDPRDGTIMELRRLLGQREAEIERLQDLINQLRGQVVDVASLRTRLAEAEAELVRVRGNVFVG